jgi:hypothetical protein
LFTSLLLLLHVLVLVYWLGGDLGAFYTSRYLIRPDLPADRRLLAAKIVSDVDMAPRTALILTLPTGLAAAEARSWISLGWPVVGLVAILALGWLAVAWRLHDRGASRPLAAVDRAFRWGLFLGAAAAGTAALIGVTTLPFFIAIKLLILAACVALGLVIRIVLKPLGPALGGLSEPESGAEVQVRSVLLRARPLVALIWALLVAAAFFGLHQPTSL